MLLIVACLSAFAADVRYNEVAFACTHNAMSNAEDGWLFPNQEYNIAHQLKDGIRAMMLDIYYDYYNPSVIILQHGYGVWAYTCGHEKLSTGLSVIKNFLDTNPNEIITIIFESHIDAADVKEEFMRAGLMSYLHEQTTGQPWSIKTND